MKLDNYTEKTESLDQESARFMNELFENKIDENCTKELERLEELQMKLEYLGLKSSFTYQNTKSKLERILKRFENYSRYYSMVSEIRDITEGKAKFLSKEFLLRIGTDKPITYPNELSMYSGRLSKEVVDRLYTIKQMIEVSLSKNGFEYLNTTDDDHIYDKGTLFYTVSETYGVLIYQIFPLGIIVYEVL